MMTGPAKTQMTLLESMRDYAKRLRDMLSDGFNRLLQNMKPTTPSSPSLRNHPIARRLRRKTGSAGYGPPGEVGTRRSPAR